MKPVGANLAKAFVPLTEIPPPNLPHVHTDVKSGRRHMEDCNEKPTPKEVVSGARVDIFGEYYDDFVAKTVATVIFPDHIDREYALLFTILLGQKTNCHVPPINTKTS